MAVPSGLELAARLFEIEEVHEETRREGQDFGKIFYLLQCQKVHLIVRESVSEHIRA